MLKSLSLSYWEFYSKWQSIRTPLVRVSEVELDYLSNTPEGVSSLLLNLELSVRKGRYVVMYIILHH